MNASWQKLADELARWRDAGREAQLWLRDDDAVEPTQRLGQLIELTARFDVPVTLAVIPALTGPALARRLAQAPHVHPVIHGWSHANHAPASEKKQELGSHRPRQVVLNDLALGFARLSKLYGDHLAPLLVPPWNRIDPTLLDDLPGLGYRGLSAFGHKPVSRPGLTVANTHIDIIDSRAGNACRDHGVLIASLVEELDEARRAGGRPIGILSHHLVSGEEAFRFLENLFMATATETVRWLAPGDLLP